MQNFIYVMFLCFFVAVQLHAQSGSGAGSVISGRVADSSTEDPMGAATVSVLDNETGSVVTGTITGPEGEFVIPGIPFGIYDISVSFVGYEMVRRDSVELSDDNPELSLGTILLTPSEVSLDEVMVVSERPVIENRGDMIVYNVASDETSLGTQAIDVLRKVPQVTVDADGNVELQGNSNIRFLINGKTSSVFGNNLADALASIPASQIRTIEAITNPGAKYDLQGSGGVINIVLQETRLQGASGNLNVTAGTRNQNGSVNLGIKRGGFGVNGYLSGNWRLGNDGSFSMVRESTDTVSGYNMSLLQSGLNRFERNGYRAGAGFEWDINESLSFSGNAGYNNFEFGGSGLVDLNETIRDNSGIVTSGLSTIRNFTNSRETGSFDWNLDLRKKFAGEGHSLDVIFNSTYGRPLSYYLVTLSETNDASTVEGSESNNPGTDNTTTIQADYVLPLSETSSFEAGIKGTFNDITSSVSVEVYNPESDSYIFDPLQSYNLGYSLDVYAAYVSAGFRLFNWLDLKTGARYEYSDISIDYPGASVPSYGTLVPSVLLSHNFSERNSLQLSYTRRIRRPDYRDLNPFVNRSDPYNIETGNVLLSPESGERIELSFSSGFATGGNLRLTLAQRIDSREIEDITNFYPEYVIGDTVYRNVSVRTLENIGSEYSTGFNVFGSLPVTSKLNFRTNMGLFHTYLATDRREGNFSTGFRFRGNLNATWQMPKDFRLEFFGFWRSGGKSIQGREPSFYIYNFALRKLFWNDTGSLGVTATNIFSRGIRQVTTITTENSVSTNTRELPFRSFGVSFTYRFGKMQNGERENRNNDVDSFGGNGE